MPDEKPQKSAGERRGLSVKISPKGPPIFGYADGCGIIDHDHADEIVFYDTAGHRSVARIMVDHAIRADQLWTTSAEFYETTEKVLAEQEIRAAPVGGVPPDITLLPGLVACNVFRIFRAGTEAAFEGYYVSPGSIHMARLKQETKPVVAQAICHVQMTLPLLLGLLEAVQRRVKGEE